jgi:CheY-like chemotaxis protein
MRSDESTLWLVAEDSDDDFFLFDRACARLNSPPKLRRATDGLEVKDYLAGNAPFNNREAYPLPAVVVSDLKMPCVDGLELLAWFKQQLCASRITFVLMTSSNAQSDRIRASEGGADEYLVKPGKFEDLVKTIAGISERHSSEYR